VRSSLHAAAQGLSGSHHAAAYPQHGRWTQDSGAAAPAGSPDPQLDTVAVSAIVAAVAQEIAKLRHDLSAASSLLAPPAGLSLPSGPGTSEALLSRVPAPSSSSSPVAPPSAAAAALQRQQDRLGQLTTQQPRSASPPQQLIGVQDSLGDLALESADIHTAGARGERTQTLPACHTVIADGRICMASLSVRACVRVSGRCIW
jgi:hypothetical protein